MDNFDNHPGLIKSSPHWRVNIKPDQFKKDAFSSLSECWDIIEALKVSLRGWDFPHINRNQIINSDDWIASYSDFEGHFEYWRFYQSGQFIFLNKFKEVDYHEELLHEAPKRIFGFTGDTKCTGFNDITLMLYFITEVFELASRLARKISISNSMIIRIEMHDIKDRVLITTVQLSELHRIYRASVSSLEKEWQLSFQDLIANSAEIAINAVAWFFERFNWQKIPLNVIKEQQQKFLEKRI